jgi:glucose/arabinose dehydrogenase
LPGKRLRAALACATALTLAACDEQPFDVASEIGPNPKLPPLQQYLLPPMHLAPVVGWKDGEKPIVLDGLKIEALATGLQHPRSLFVLPNGDVLVVQSKQPWPDPIHRPKDMVMAWIEFWVTSGGDTGPSNRITLLRDADGDGKPETQSVFLDHLNSPFGVALVGNDLYVANTDAIVRYPYTTGDTKITAPGTVLTPLPGGPIDHHWTKEPGRKPGRVAALRGRRVQQQHHRKRHRGGDEPCRHLGGRAGNRPLAHLRERPAQP